MRRLCCHPAGNPSRRLRLIAASPSRAHSRGPWCGRPVRRRRSTATSHVLIFEICSQRAERGGQDKHGGWFNIRNGYLRRGTMRLSDFKVLTFDCYGTLVDWEGGIIEALKPLTDRVKRELTRDEILEAHARHEFRHQRQTPSKRYQDL